MSTCGSKTGEYFKTKKKKKVTSPFETFSTKESRMLLESYRESKRRNYLYFNQHEKVEEKKYRIEDAIEFYKKGKFDEALKCINKVIEDDASHESLMLCGEILWKLGEYQQSIEMITHSLSLHPYNPKAYYIRGDCYRNLQDFENTIKEWEKYLKLEPPSSQLLIHLGKSKSTIGDYEGAIECFTKILDLKLNDKIESNDEKNDDAYVYFLRGDCYERMKMMDKAEEDYKKVLELDPNFSQPYLEQAMELQNNKEYEKALSIMEPILKIETDNPQLYKQTAIILMNLGDEYLHRAIHMLSKAISLLGSDTTGFDEIFYLRGSIHDKLNSTNEAIVDYTTCLQMNPNHIKALGSRARVFAKIGDSESASLDFEKLLTIESKGNADAYLYLAEMYYKKGNYNHALKYFVGAWENNGLILGKTEVQETILIQEKVSFCLANHFVNTFEFIEDEMPQSTLFLLACEAFISLYPDYPKKEEPEEKPSTTKKKTSKKNTVKQQEEQPTEPKIIYNEPINNLKEIWSNFMKTFQQKVQIFEDKKKKMKRKK